MLSFLQNLPQKRVAWLLLAASALILELCALYFQHVLNLAPCVMCVYERLVIVGLLFAGLLGAIAPKNRGIALVAFSLWAYSAVRGLLLAIEHVNYQLHPSPFVTCDFFPNFPSWAPLHQWMPWMFNPTGDCSDVSWTMLGYSMPQWLIFAFALYIIAFVLVTISLLLPRKN